MSADSRESVWAKVRMGTEEWADFGRAVDSVYPSKKGSRSRVLRDFMRWYMRKPGATSITRPPAGEWSKAD